MLFLIFVIVVVVVVTLIIYLCYPWKDNYGPCASLEQCQQSCKHSSYRNVLYSYFLYRNEDEPSSRQYFDKDDIIKRFKKVIDSGYNIVNLSFYQYGSIDYVGAFGKFCWLSQSDQKNILTYARDKGVKLLVSAGGAAGTSSFHGVDYQKIGDEIDALIQTYGLNGLDIDVEDPGLFPMITSLTNYLGAKWKGKDLLLTHAPQSANFGDNKGAASDYFTVYAGCGDYIDFLNVQFYNQGCTHDSYDEIFNPYRYDCWNIVWISTGKQTCDKDGCIIPINKILVGKPIEIGTYGAGNGYVDPKTLGGWFSQAKTELGWDAGLMIWCYYPDSNKAADYVKTLYSNL